MDFGLFWKELRKSEEEEKSLSLEHKRRLNGIASIEVESSKRFYEKKNQIFFLFNKKESNKQNLK